MLKRAFDFSLALGGLIASAPLWALFAAAVKLEDGGPIFFRQERVGLAGRPFMAMKFRSMRPDAEAGVDAVLQRLLRRAHCVLVTDGVAPIRWHTRTRAGTAPTYPVYALDTTAAGDAFVGAWLQALVALELDAADVAAFFEHAALDEPLRLAAAAGALATTRHGAFAAMPTRDEVQRLVEAGA